MYTFVILYGNSKMKKSKENILRPHPHLQIQNLDIDSLLC
jgi:hypothetical protein